MGYTIFILVFIFLAYAFAGVFSFIPYFLGLILNFFNFPIDIISQFVYPVGVLPYFTLYGGLVFFMILIIIRLIFPHK